MTAKKKSTTKKATVKKKSTVKKKPASKNLHLNSEDQKEIKNLIKSLRNLAHDANHQLSCIEAERECEEQTTSKKVKVTSIEKMWDVYDHHNWYAFEEIALSAVRLLKKMK